MDVALSCSHHSERAWGLILTVNLTRSRIIRRQGPECARGWRQGSGCAWGQGYVDEVNSGWFLGLGSQTKWKGGSKPVPATIISFFLNENTLWTSTQASASSISPPWWMVGPKTWKGYLWKVKVDELTGNAENHPRHGQWGWCKHLQILEMALESPVEPGEGVRGGPWGTKSWVGL